MKKSKHMRDSEKKSYKKIIVFLISIIIIFLFVLCKDSIFIKNIDTNPKEDIIEKEEPVSIDEDITLENEKLVLKSNYEENKKRQIIYSFKENKLNEVKILETYTNEESYTNEKEKYSKRADIEIIKIDDEQFQIHYKKLNLGSDEGLSYEQIYQKYMGIIGAYEVI